MGLSRIREKLVKAMQIMAKNEKKHGRSARRGNAPSPYTKYQKKPYIYPWAKKASKQAESRVS